MIKHIVLVLFVLSSAAHAQEDPQTQKTSWKQVFYKAISMLPTFVVESGISIPVYGNYCGPNHGDGNYWVPPIDTIDLACMRHDMCYDPNVGGDYLSCACDAQLIDDLLVALANPSKLEYRAISVGSVITAWFSQSACDCKTPAGNKVFLERPGFFEKGQCAL